MAVCGSPSIFQAVDVTYVDLSRIVAITQRTELAEIRSRWRAFEESKK